MRVLRRECSVPESLGTLQDPPPQKKTTIVLLWIPLNSFQFLSKSWTTWFENDIEQLCKLDSCFPIFPEGGGGGDLF